MGRENKLSERLARGANLFKGLSLEQVEKIINSCVKISLNAGDALFDQGDAGNEMYVLLSGTMQVSTRRGEVVIADITPIKVIGEISILIDSKRTATVKAREFSQLLKLSRDRLDYLFSQDIVLQKTIYHNLCSILCERLVKNNIQLEVYALTDQNQSS